MHKPKIVCLCGSTRFYEAFQRANFEETMAGKIVLSVGFYPHAEEKAHGQSIGCSEEQKQALDDLHKRKIDLADEILVLNVRGYVGESTQSEIDYARATGKSVRWLQNPHCNQCRHSGMDMDMSPYCAHPLTLEGAPHGSNLARRDPARDHCGEGKRSWENRS